MKKLRIKFLIILLLTLLSFLASYKFLLHIYPKNQSANVTQVTIKQALSRVTGSDQWVLAKGYYGIVVYDPDDEDKERPVYFGGVVMVGINVSEIEAHQAGQELTILYPSPGLIGVDLKEHRYFSDENDQRFYNEALMEAKPKLYDEAIKEGILTEAEQRLETELKLLVQNLAPDKVITLMKKEPSK